MIDQQVESLAAELADVSARPPIRPSASRWSHYRKCRDEAAPSSVATGFDTDVLLLVADRRGPRLSTESTLQMTRALRNTIIKHSGIQPVPDWVSGHTADGQPLQDRVGHIACIPLPACGHRHSDGHLLGAGIVFPRTVDRSDRGQVLRPLLVDEDGDSKRVELKLGRLGVWSLFRRDWSESRVALNPETWTKQPDGSHIWASVTPVVLDRFPKTDRCKEHSTWVDEVRQLVVASCQNIGLPEPTELDIDTTSWQTGIPRATQKRRPLRGQANSPSRDAALGNGFPAYPAKNANASKPQVHVWLRFAEPVVGPVLLGAGRFLGYGLCMPWSAKQCNN
jgi:CRISPR-associated protein Csb2